MKTSDFKQLTVWQRAMDLTIDIYETIKILPKEERFGLSDQMRRSVVSIPSNIAEGQARNSVKEFKHFLSIARGSVAELKTQLIICERLNYIEKSTVTQLIQGASEIDRMLCALMRTIDRRNPTTLQLDNSTT